MVAASLVTEDSEPVPLKVVIGEVRSGRVRRAAMQTSAARQASLEIAARQASLETQMDPEWIEAQQASVEIAVRASLQNSVQRNEGAEEVAMQTSVSSATAKA